MKCPNCKAKSTVKKVYLENKEGIKDRRHQCCSCGNEFFSYQTVNKTLSAAMEKILLHIKLDQ
jgi:transcriptional regulator NrdR family protein